MANNPVFSEPEALKHGNTVRQTYPQVCLVVHNNPGISL